MIDSFIDIDVFGWLADDRSIDMWSVCLCLYELFTGHVMFPGRSNNEMLKLIMAIKGRFGAKQLKAFNPFNIADIW